ncbi:MAG: isoprenylcysteine carboxylmethyltransferase family protein [Terracidiphilus sp.]|nr:isoprenylcysteine carboxylmethyltransferase family protein [Terracidiphilus sp.]
MTHQSLQLAAWAELALCWFLWLLASVLTRGKGPRPEKAISASAGGVGIFINIIGLACLAIPFRPSGYLSPLFTIIPAMIIAPMSMRLVWAARKHIGRNWRAGAVLNDDHILVKTGPYERMRHPIYASLLGMVVATAFAYSWWPLGVAGIIITLFGIEMRLKAEERIMERFFQDEFIEYKARTRAFFPF